MAKGKSKRRARVNWRKVATEAEHDARAARQQLAELQPIAELVRSLSDALLENMREEIRSMVEEEVQQLDIHIG